MKKYIFYYFIVFMLYSLRLDAQCFADVKLDRQSVYAEQPFRVTISVLTSTFYTAPLEFDSLQIPGAYIIPFGQTMPGNFTVNGKSYAGLTFYFIVFPYKPGSYDVPSFSIRATTPPPNSAVSRKITIKTKPVSFTVKDMPADYQGADWFVAKNVTLSDHWNKSLTNLKTGDMVERTITLNAYGTLPQFIPDFIISANDFSSFYPGEILITDTRNDYDANGQLKQKFTYLMEKPGDYEFPAISVKWWNPYAEKTYVRGLPSDKVHVITNPDLGMLTTIRDSLHKTVDVTIPDKPNIRRTWLIGGIAWYWALLICLGVIICLYWLVRILIYLVSFLRSRWKIYINSEPYLFKKFYRFKGNNKEQVSRLYHWWNSTPYFSETPSITEYVYRKNEIIVRSELKLFFEQRYKGETSPTDVNYKLRKELKKFRKKLLRIPNRTIDKGITPDQMDWN